MHYLLQSHQEVLTVWKIIKYIIGQINGLEATRQELSNLLEDKEQNEKGTVININTKQ